MNILKCSITNNYICADASM